MQRRGHILIAALLGLGFGAGALSAQETPEPGIIPAQPQPPSVEAPPVSAILTLSSDRLYTGSEYGRRAISELEAQGAVLAAENRRIEAELVLEEQELTRLRGEMSPDEFRVLADAFDEKVQAIRREQEIKARSVNERGEIDRIRFFDAVEPILIRIMQDTGASVILERSTVLMSANATDVTDFAIDQINAALGDGSAVPDP